MLGWKDGEFFETNMENINMVVDIALETDGFAGAAMSMMENSKKSSCNFPAESDGKIDVGASG